MPDRDGVAIGEGHREVVGPDERPRREVTERALVASGHRVLLIVALQFASVRLGRRRRPRNQRVLDHADVADSGTVDRVGARVP